MNIWHSHTQAYDRAMNGHECDDECECPTECTPRFFNDEANHALLNSSFSPLDREKFDYICTSIFQQAPSLYIQPFSHEYSIVCNPVDTGQIAVVDVETNNFLNVFKTPITFSQLSATFPDWSSERLTTAIAQLYKLGFLQNVEHPLVMERNAQSQTLRVWLHVTNACNLNCTYCYISKTSEHMAEDISSKAIDAVFRSATNNNFQRVKLQYAGGESSLRLPQVLSIHDYAQNLAQRHNIELYAIIMSNGVYIGQDAIERLKERAIGIMLSLDGIGAYHDAQRPFISGRGSFKYVDRTIKRLLANSLKPAISVVVSQRTLAGLPELVEYILDHNLRFSLNYYRDNECSTHIRDLQFEEEQMIKAMRIVFARIESRLPERCLLGSLIDKASLSATHQHTCGVGHNYMVIDQRGGVAKCQADIKRTVATIAADDPLFFIRNDPNGVRGYAVDEKETCRSCAWRYWCTGGCPLLTYKATGRSDVKSPNCNIYKALFPDVLRLEALRLLKYETPIFL